jgi:transposase-like protein
VIKTFAQLYGARFPEAVKKITYDEEELPVFYDCPAEHWVHLRTTNPGKSARQRWRAMNAPHRFALVRAGARFERGRILERPEVIAA